MAFGLAGLLWVVPHAEILDYLPAGQTLFRWSMAGGGVGYIVLGAIAVSLYAYRTLGLKALLVFATAAIGISLSSELLGTSTGFPFGHYSYLNGLGWKVAGLVPFTIPLSWFYLGLSSLLLARGGVLPEGGIVRCSWLRSAIAIAIGAALLTSWDFVLDPAMSQTALPFWYWHQPGAFFGMPYQNFAGWFGTGVVFMTAASLGWYGLQVIPSVAVEDLTVPLVVYIANFTFALVMSLGAGFYIPIMLGLVTGVMPAVWCYWSAKQRNQKASVTLVEPATSLTKAVEPSVAAAKVVVK
jgi:putative membrane protein